MTKFCVLKNFTIKETIDRINSSRNRAAIVVNNEEAVIGVVSQGDIIRALNSGKSIYSRVDGILQPNFISLKERDMEKAYNVFRKKAITLLPVVDEDFKLQSVITLIDIFDYLRGEQK